MRIALEEVLGDRRPPDLSSRILEALAHPENASPEQLEAGQRAVDAALLQTPKATNVRAERAVVTPVAKNRNPQDTLTIVWSSLALLLAISLSIASIIAITIAMRPPETANAETPDAPSSIADHGNGSPNMASPSSNELLTPTPQVAERTSSPQDTADPTDSIPEQQTPETLLPSPANLVRSVPEWTPTWDSQAAQPSTEVVSTINSGLQARWSLAHVQPSPAIDDITWAERAFLALIGRRPDAYELVEFEAGSVDRAAWARYLTESEKYRPLFAQAWGARLSKHLLDQSAPGRHLVAPEAFQSFLAERVLAGVGLDQLVEELLTAEGGLSPSQPDFNPAVSYLVALDDRKGIAATRSVLEKFWGDAARCAVCHDHSASPSLTQDEFWSTNAHLRQMVVEGNQESGLRLNNVDFHGELDDPEHVAVFYETPKRELIATFPRFAEGLQFPESGRVEQFDRRRALGRRIVTDLRFPETMVDWAWSEILDYPLGQANDGIEMRRELALQFAANGFQIHELVVWIVLSEAFNRREDNSAELAIDSPWIGSSPLFARHYSQQPKFQSPNQALARLEKAYESGLAEILAFRSGEAFSERPSESTDGLANVDRDQGVDWQLLEGWNASPNLSAQLNQIVTSPLSVRQKVEHLFMLSSGSSASQEQLVRCEKLIENSNEPLSVYRDLWFALSNTRSR